MQFDFLLKNGPSPNSTPRMGWTWKQVLISKWAELELGVLSFSAQNQPIILECRSGPITTTINSNLVSDSLCTWRPFTQARPTRCRYAKAPKRPKHPPYSIQLPTLFMDNIVFLRKEKPKKRKTSIVAKRGEQREREREEIGRSKEDENETSFTEAGPFSKRCVLWCPLF